MTSSFFTGIVATLLSNNLMSVASGKLIELSIHNNQNFLNNKRFAQKPDSTSIDVAPSVLATIDALDDDLMSFILNLATESKQIFGQTVLYMTLNWESTGCGWINGISGLVENGWEYSTGKGKVVPDSYSVFDDIAQIFDPLFAASWDFSGMSRGLFEELEFLLYHKKDYKMARLKYNLWKINGIEWDHEFVQNLGFETDDEMEDAMTSALNKLYSKHKTKDGIKKECELLDPVELINPIFIHTLPSIAPVWSSISTSFADTAISLNFGATTCSQLTTDRCIGGGFGFAVDGLGNAALYQLNGGNIVIDDTVEIQSDSDVASSLFISLGVYENIDAVIGTVSKSMIDGMDAVIVSELPSEKVIGTESFYSFDLNSGQLIPSIKSNLGTFDVEQVAVLISPRIAALSVDENYDSIMKDSNYPRPQPEINGKNEKITDNENDIISDVFDDEKNKILNKNSSQTKTSTSGYFLYIVLGILSVAVIVAITGYVIKQYSHKQRRDDEEITDEYQSLL